MNSAAKAKRRRTALGVAAALLIAAGIAALLFPTVNQAVYQHNVIAANDTFSAAVAAEAENIRTAELHALLEARNEELFRTEQAGLVSVDSYEHDDIDLTTYGLPEPDVIGYLEIPRLGQTLPLILGASQSNMNRGACHLTETSYPIGGENTNCVIAAHRAMMSGLSMFRDIEAIQIGDELTIENFEGTLIYRACDIQVVRPWDVDAVKIQEGRDLVTLSTCHPYGQNHQRYLVFFERVV